MDLSIERCNPEINRVPPLTRKETLEYLKEVSGWTISDKKLRRRFLMESFEGCVLFINELEDLCKREGHYPDISIEKGSELEIAWYTYQSGGITRNDFIMAAKMNQSERFRI